MIYTDVVAAADVVLDSMLPLIASNSARATHTFIRTNSGRRTQVGSVITTHLMRCDAMQYNVDVDAMRCEAMRCNVNAMPWRWRTARMHSCVSIKKNVEERKPLRERISTKRDGCKCRGLKYVGREGGREGGRGSQNDLDSNGCREFLSKRTPPKKKKTKKKKGYHYLFTTRTCRTYRLMNTGESLLAVVLCKPC